MVGAEHLAEDGWEGSDRAYQIRHVPRLKLSQNQCKLVMAFASLYRNVGKSHAADDSGALLACKEWVATRSKVVLVRVVLRQLRGSQIHPDVRVLGVWIWNPGKSR